MSLPESSFNREAAPDFPVFTHFFNLLLEAFLYYRFFKLNSKTNFKSIYRQ